jgi:hypothetical protein
MANLKILKLINNDEILGEVTRDSPVNVAIKNAVRIVLVPSKVETKDPQIGFVPWTHFYAEKEVEIHRGHIIVMSTPIDEFVKQYNAAFSGIITPQTGIITP